MTIVDSSGVVDFLLRDGIGEAVDDLLRNESELSAPDVLVFEVLSAIHRRAGRGLSPSRAATAVTDLGDVPLTLFPSMRLRHRAWELRQSFTIADGTFIALAEELDEPLATKDARLAREAAKHTAAEVVLLDAPTG